MYNPERCTTQKDVQPRNSQFIAIWPVNGVEEINRMGNKGDVGQTSRSHVVDEGDQLKWSIHVGPKKLLINTHCVQGGVSKKIWDITLVS